MQISQSPSSHVCCQKIACILNSYFFLSLRKQFSSELFFKILSAKTPYTYSLIQLGSFYGGTQLHYLILIFGTTHFEVHFWRILLLRCVRPSRNLFELDIFFDSFIITLTRLREVDFVFNVCHLLLGATGFFLCYCFLRDIFSDLRQKKSIPAILYSTGLTCIFCVF